MNLVVRSWIVLIILPVFLKCITVHEKKIYASSDLGRDAYPCQKLEGQEVNYVKCNHEFLVSRYTARIEYLKEKSEMKQDVDSVDYLYQSREAFNSGKFRRAAGYAIKVMQMETEGPVYSEAIELLYKALIGDKKYEEAYAIQKKYKH